MPRTPDWPVMERHWELAIVGVVLILGGAAMMVVGDPAAAVGFQHPWARYGWLVWLCGLVLCCIGMCWPKPGAKYS